MGLRERLNDRRRVTVWAAIALIGIAVLVIAMEIRSQLAPAMPEFGQAFYTIDDGRTYFVDDERKLPPFDHEGREAVKAYLFTCDGGETRWIGYLERFTPEGKALAKELLAGKGPPNANQPTIVTDLEVKRPGQPTWCLITSKQAEAILNVRCPHGNHAVTLIEP